MAAANKEFLNPVSIEHLHEHYNALLLKSSRSVKLLLLLSKNGF